ncbi:MAG: hypothetical protein VW868_05320, partial [Bacteroidota bacterium]
MLSKGHFLILCTLLVSTLLSCNNAYIAEVDRAEDYVYQPGYPELRVVGAGFVDVDTDSSFIELTAEVVYASLVFKNVDGLFRSQIEMDVQVVNQLQPDRIQTSTNTTYTISDSSTYVVNSQDSYQIFKRIAVPPGSYNVR